MIDAGDVCWCDLGGERRAQVLVVSHVRFHRAAGRALVCPAVGVRGDELPPWFVPVGDEFFAIDRIVARPVERVLEQVGRAPSAAFERVRRTLRAIT